MNRQMLKPLTVAVVAITLAGCNDSSSSGSGDGSMSLDMTDAPTNEFTSVNITVTGVTLQPADDAEEDSGDGDTEDGNGENGDGDDSDRISFNVENDEGEPKTINLLDLQGGVTETLLSDEDVPAGDYAWMRLDIVADDVFVTSDSGEEHSVFVPSGAQRGMQTTSFTVSEEGETNFTIDFDARKSIVTRGSSGKDLILKPILRLVENEEVGAISGTVDVATLKQNNDAFCEDDFDGMVYVHQGADATVGEFGSDSEPLVAAPVSMDDEENNYTYKAAFLEEASYQVSYVCESDDNEEEGDITEFINTEEVEVTAGETTTHNFDGSSQ
ncbi:DUF4382 domain-containing protein [Halospina denitrificans]|nr:DUF4382 domain-containing protein [Halospina denitrificans]